jgi:hypothetical protein
LFYRFGSIESYTLSVTRAAQEAVAGEQTMQRKDVWAAGAKRMPEAISPVYGYEVYRVLLR